ncbi:MAG: alpha/beta hydrolase [Polyangia bacterium]|jgi:3-oxoadipate enol-lactonase
MKISIGSRQLAYESVGSGPVLVLLHAFPFDSRMWRKTAAALAGQRRVITPDMRGFGLSDLGSGGSSIADLADDVASLLDALNLPAATVGGMSMGGYVALAFARRHRDRLKSLVLADTKAAADTPEARQGREAAIALVEQQGVPALLEKQIPRLLSASASDSLRAEVRALGAQSPEAIIAAIRALRDRPDRTAELPEIAVPTLVVVGSDDALSPPAEARVMAAAMPDARVVEIPGAAHLSNLENPDAFSAALAGFA